MNVVDIAPKDIHILLDFSLKELLNLKLILDNMTFNFDGDKQNHVDAKVFLEGELYSTITSTIKELTDGA